MKSLKYQLQGTDPLFYFGGLFPWYFSHLVISFSLPLPIFSRQASLAQQAFLITPLRGARYKTGKNAYAKK